jgi:4-hydroxythreonine-4-phosphate dehydrogenase
MKIGITMGDSSGVGPEIVLKAYSDGVVGQHCIVIGDSDILHLCNETLGYGIPMVSHERIPETCERGALNVVDLHQVHRGEFRPGEISKLSGAAALAYLEYAIRAACERSIDAIVTLPMNKEATRMSRPDFTGHTEVIARMCGSEHYTMMLASEKLLVGHVSTHVSLRSAIDMVTADRVYRVIVLLDDAMRRMNRSGPIAVPGLNPHAGEAGAFGQEEIEHIVPGIERATEEGIAVEGPLPPDTVFMKALDGRYGAVVCMYHDQGHIPMKMVSFHQGVNITIGLPIVRTSVDHGTAFDIAWRGTASTQSFIHALLYAEQLSVRL